MLMLQFYLNLISVKVQAKEKLDSKLLGANNKLANITLRQLPLQLAKPDDFSPLPFSYCFIEGSYLPLYLRSFEVKSLLLSRFRF